MFINVNSASQNAEWTYMAIFCVLYALLFSSVYENVRRDSMKWVNKVREN